MGILNRKSTTPPPRSSHMPLPCQVADCLLLLLKMRVLHNLPDLLTSPPGDCLLLLLKMSQDSPVSNLLNQAAAKQAEGNLRIGGIPSGEVEAARDGAGKIAAGRIGHNHQKEVGVKEDEVGVDAEKGSVDVEKGVVEEEGAVIEEDGEGDRPVAVLQVAVPTLAGVVTGAR